MGPADTIETMGGKCTDTFQATSVSFNISILWYFLISILFQAITGDTTPLICGENAGEHGKDFVPN